VKIFDPTGTVYELVNIYWKAFGTACTNQTNPFTVVKGQQQGSVAVTLQISIREVLGSNFG
jgi:hypothetical protein